MSVEVAIGRLNLELPGEGDAREAERFVRTVLASMESELEATLAGGDEVVTIPRIDLVLDVIDAEAIGSAVASRLREAWVLSRRTRAPRPAARSQARAMSRIDRAEALVEAALAIRRGEACELEALASVEEIEEPSVWHLPRAVRTLAVLSAIARRLSGEQHIEMLSVLDERACLELLKRLERELIEARPQPVWRESPLRSRANLRELRERQRVRLRELETREASPARVLLFAIAEAVRFTARTVAGDPVLIAEILLLSEEVRRAEAERSLEEVTAPREEVRVSLPELAAPTVEPRSTATVEEEVRATTELVSSELAEEFSMPRRIRTRLGGLAFLASPMLAVGLEGAGSLEIAAILRRLVAREVGPESVKDAAAWVLAGLTDELPELFPCDRDAIEEAAAACVFEARARLAEVDPDLDLRDVLLLNGVLAIFDDRVAATLPYPKSYAALLRAGLLKDIKQVPWLEDRELRLVFREGVDGDEEWTR